MPIAVMVNEPLCLRIVHFTERVASSEVADLVAIYGQERDWLGYDSVYLLDADGSDIDRDGLDDLRQSVFALYREIDLMIVRRSAWICRTEPMRRLAEYWITARHARDGSGAEFRLGDRLEDALGLFTADELAAVSARAGFSRVASIGVEPDPR